MTARSSMRQRSSARRAPSLFHDMYAETPSVATCAVAQLVAVVDLGGERVLGLATRPELLLDVVLAALRRTRAGACPWAREIAVGHHGDERRLEAVGALDFLVDALERVEVRVDRRVDLARLGDEDHQIRRLARAARPRSTRARSTSSASAGADPSCTPRVSRIDIAPPLALVVVPAPAPRLRGHVPELGHLRAEERVDQRRLSGPAPPDQHERGRSLLEQHRAQRRDADAEVLRHLEREALEQLLEAGDRARQRLQGVVVGDAIFGWAFVRLRRVQPPRPPLSRPSSGARSLP